MVQILITLVCIVFGLLQLILFFKIWGMTNDVNNIKKQLPDGDLYQKQDLKEAKIYALKGEIDMAANKYQDAFYSDLESLHFRIIARYGHSQEDSSRDNEYKERYEELVNKYKKLFKKIDRELKDETKFDTFQKVESLIH